MAELTSLIDAHAPQLIAQPGCGTVTAAISSSSIQRHRLDRGEDRQLNRAIHIIALSRARTDPETRAYLARKHAEGKTNGGAIITGAGIDDRVVGLVYIAAVAPDEDETAASQQAKYPVTDVFQQIEVADGRVWMLPSGIGYFCGDLPEEEQQVVRATATPPAATLFTEKPPGTAWRTKPSAFVVATHDHSVHPDLHRDSAKRMGATTYEVASSHCAMLSHPDVVLDAIRNLVTSLQGTLATA